VDDDFSVDKLAKLYEEAQQVNNACAKVFVKVYGNAVGRYRWFGINKRQIARMRLNRNINKKNFYCELDKKLGAALATLEAGSDKK
jgi:hypothetical protein